MKTAINDLEEGHADFYNTFVNSLSLITMKVKSLLPFIKKKPKNISSPFF